MIKIILNGCNGRMGQAISRLADSNPQTEIVCGIDVSTAWQNSFDVVDDITKAPTNADVVVDFSNPASLPKLLEFSTKTNIPLVLATTGFSAAQIAEINKSSENVPIFFTANMSLGVNLLLDLVAKTAKILQDDFDIEIIEKHHNTKIDAPSGTALTIANTISDALDTPCEYMYDRHSIRRKREKKEIGISAVRGGTIVGDHTVIFAGNDEIIEISHHAASREVFANGALRAAQFIVGKPNGLYNMKNIVEE